MSRVAAAPPASLFGSGYAVLPRACPTELVDALVAHADRLVFAPSRRHVGVELAAASPTDPAPRRAVSGLADAAARADLGGPFHPTEASFLRHRPGAPPIPPHRDQRYYAECVALVTLQGSARFAVHAERDRSRVLDEWETGPGDVILLRGWSPLGQADPRPYHRIDPPVELSRLVLRVRHNLAATNPPSPWVSTLTRAEIDRAVASAARPASPLHRPG